MERDKCKVTVGLTDLGSSWFKRYMKGKYVKSLQSAGAEVRLFPWTLGGEEAAALVDGCDGILLPGGADVEPSYYGQEKQGYCQATIPERDRGEAAVLAAALEAKKPILGICRGFQLINCYFGGTLYQDIAAEAGEGRLKHVDMLGHARGVHRVSITPGTQLAQIAGGGEMRVNTLHHQAARTVGEGLITSAVSEDGFVEAVELPGYPFLLAVQWHPEHLYAKQQFARDIFARFVAACGRDKGLE